jgi:1D-myo-inositol 3-kinase
MNVQFKEFRHRIAQQDAVIVGHVTRDLVGQAERLGGAVSYAALACVRLGVRSRVLTAAAEEPHLLAPLSGIEMHIIPSPVTTTFALHYVEQKRTLFLHHKAIDIEAAMLPADLCGTAFAYVAPVMGECVIDVVQRLRAKYAVLGLQGWLRKVEDKRVVPAILPDVLALSGNCENRVDSIVFSELDHPEGEAIARQLASQVPVVALTRGACGATLWVSGVAQEISAVPANEVDPTGAGDVFGIVLGLALSVGIFATQAAELASFCASRVVEGPGLGNLGSDCSV